MRDLIDRRVDQGASWVSVVVRAFRRRSGMTDKSSSVNVGSVVTRATLLCGVVGFAAGLVWGLVVYAPTAWAAAFEVGVPSAAIGVALGFGIVGVQIAVRR
jgi:hypothetical protein